MTERSSLASFSACGGSLLRQNSLPTHGDPRGAFFCHRTQFPMTERSSLASFSACGGSLLRQNSLPMHGDPRGAFFCHRTQFPMTEKLIADLHNHTAVGLIALNFCRAHNQQALLIINLKECNTITFMINRCQVSVIRENCNILGIFPADR